MTSGKPAANGKLSPEDVARAREAAEEAKRQKARERAADPEVARDIQTLGGMVGIWCADHHEAALRTPYAGFGVECGCYGQGKVPALCPECAAHLEYGELKRCMCRHDPKPSCRVCETHCYKPEEAAWQRQAMAYAGPRAMFRGMFLDAIRHMRSEMKARSRAKKAGR